MNSHPGEIEAEILVENGQVLMRKTCPTHGEFEDVLATDANFLERIEGLFFDAIFAQPKTIIFIITELLTSNTDAARF